MKKSIDESKKLNDSDKQVIQDSCVSTIKWIDANQHAEQDEFEYKLKEIEKICKPIIGPTPICFQVFLSAELKSTY